MKTRLFVLGGLLALGILGVIWFYNNFEKALVKEWVGASGEARKRPYLAAERFAERMGLNAKELRAVPELYTVPVTGALLLPNRRQSLTKERMGELVRWAERGGHLIIEAEYKGVPDPLLDALGVKRDDSQVSMKPLRIELPNGRTLSVFIPAGFKLALSEKDVRLRAGDQLVSYGRGRGVVTVITSFTFARNSVIGSNDHAEFLWHLLKLTPARELTVFWSPGRLSLWEFLKTNAAPALAAAGLLLFLWLWSIAPRFGPVVPDAPPGRRRLLDHLRASGRYYWVKGLRSRLVVAARDAALRRIARAQPDFAGASAAERAARLSSLAQISKEEATRFMAAAGAMRGADFIKITQDAQRVHSALEKGSK